MLELAVAAVFPLIFDDGQVACVLMDGPAEGAHERAIVAWAETQGEVREEESQLPPCAPIPARDVAVAPGLGSAVQIALPITGIFADDGVQVEQMRAGWLHIHGEGELAVLVEGGAPVLLSPYAGAPAKPLAKLGTLVDLGFEPVYSAGTAKVVPLGQHLLVVSAGDLMIQGPEGPPQQIRVVPGAADPTISMGVGKKRSVKLDDAAVSAIVADPAVVSAEIRGGKVRFTAWAPGDTRAALVGESGRMTPVRVVVQ